MIKYLLKKVKGKGFVLDEKISQADLYSIAFKYALMLVKGFAIFRRRVFLGKSVKLSKRRNLLLGNWVKISDYVRIDALAKEIVVIGDGCSIGEYTRIECTGSIQKVGIGLSIGKGSGIGAFSFIGAAGGVTVGENVIMGQYVSFHSENHNFNSLEIPIKLQGVTSKGIVIGDDCWVGSKVTFLDGAHVGHGCVVAAGAVVSGTFPDNSVIGGVPAKILKYRG